MDLIKKHTAYSCILISKLIREAFIKKKKDDICHLGFCIPVEKFNIPRALQIKSLTRRSILGSDGMTKSDCSFSL